MPRTEIDFDPIDKAPFGEEVFGYDFSNLLSDGETIVSSQWDIEATRGIDLAPQIRAVGGCQISGNFVLQLIANCILGERYYFRATITTSKGAVISLWSHCECDDVPGPASIITPPIPPSPPPPPPPGTGVIFNDASVSALIAAVCA